MESRRDISLRRRLKWCCILAIALMSIAVLGHGMELLTGRIEVDPVAARIPPASAPAAPVEGASPGPFQSLFGLSPDAYPSNLVLLVSSTALVVLYAVVLVLTVRTRPAVTGGTAPRQPVRNRLVAALSWMTLAAVFISVPAEVSAQWADLNWGPPGAVARVYQDTTRAGYTATNAFGILFLLACALVPMRLTESLRIALPSAAVVMGSVIMLLIPPRETTVTLGLMTAGYTIIGCGWSAWRYADFEARIRAHALDARYRDLSGEVRAISHELGEARLLHEALFPTRQTLDGPPGSPVRVAFRYEPAREIGGDFLDVHREPPTPGLPDGGATIVVIDVSGHGVIAALAVNRLHAQLRQFFGRYPRRVPTGPASSPSAEPGDGGPGHLLTVLNTYTATALAEQAVYATAIAVHINPAIGGEQATLRWASAGHPSGYLRAPAGKVVEIQSTAAMLGVLEPELFTAGETSTPIGGGDRLILLTDGAIESRDARGMDFTPERLRAAVADAPVPEAAASLLDGLMAAVQAHRHGRILDDTLLVEVLLRPEPASVAAPAKAPTDNSRSV